MITNIRCMSKHMKRRKKGWQVIAETTETWSSYPISNMLIARDYFGGVMEIKTKSSRRFGNIIESIVVTDENEVYRNVYYFDYSGAIEYETERGFPLLHKMLR